MKGFKLNDTLSRVVVVLADRLDLSLEQLHAIASEVAGIEAGDDKNAAIRAIANTIPRGPVLRLDTEQGLPVSADSVGHGIALKRNSA